MGESLPFLVWQLMILEIFVLNESFWSIDLGGLGSLLTPFLLAVVSFVAWRYQKAAERRINLEERLRDERIGIYNQILEPFITLLMSDAAWQADPKNKRRDKIQIATSRMLSLEYRKASFQFVLKGSDTAVRAFNDLMKRAISPHASNDASYATEMIGLFGVLLLEIRKSMGNEATKINSVGMLEWFIVDAESVLVAHKGRS
ncbi:MAG: hypothetical protein OXC91_02530 [Rhodobacteraceae bacterium]|nr:hypothetical protein [Paracoccaceae bacterium]